MVILPHSSIVHLEVTHLWIFPSFLSLTSAEMELCECILVSWFLLSPLMMSPHHLHVQFELFLSLAFQLCCRLLFLFARFWRLWPLHATPLGLGTGWLGNFPFSTVIAKVWTEEASCPTIFSRFETDWVCELVLALISSHSSSMVQFCCSIVEWVRFSKFWNASSHCLGWV